MIIDTATTQYRQEKTVSEIASMLEEYQESVKAARKFGNETLVLDMLRVVHAIQLEAAHVRSVIEVAIGVLPDNTDSIPAEATLNGCIALHKQLQDKLWSLAGLVTAHADDAHQAQLAGAAVSAS